MLQAYEKKLKQDAAKAASAAAAAAQQQQQQQAWGNNAAAGPKKSLAEIQVRQTRVLSAACRVFWWCVAGRCFLSVYVCR